MGPLIKSTTYILYCLALFSTKALYAQLPSCPNGHFIYLSDGNSIFNFDADQPIVPGVNPVINSIALPASAYGLAVGRNFYAVTPATTFYVIINFQVYYYNGSAWINSNHSAGLAYNLGMGGGYIYGYAINGDIWRYDGTGDAVFLLNIGSQGMVADLSVDCSGNFYALINSNPQSMDKYNSSGVLLNSYALTGAPVGGGGGGVAIFGNDVFYDDGSEFMHGTFNGNTVNFIAGPMPLPYIGDFANCPGIATPTQVMDTICSNQFPYLWNGNSYAAPGTYTVTLPGISCDSLVTLHLAVGSSVSGPPQNVNVCPSQLPFNWNGNNYAAPGTYTVTLTSSGNCDSVATLNLAVSNVVNGPAQNISICPNLLPYSWNGNNYPAAGAYTVILTSSSGCDSIATLNLSISDAVNGPAQNISVCPTQLPYTWNGNNYPAAGTYTVTLTSSSGCDSIATLNLSIGNAVNGPAQNVSVCPNQLPYNWNGNNYPAAGTYTVTLTSNSGCDSIATLNLSIGNAVNGPAQNVSVCSTQLPYNWNGNNYPAAGTYSVTLTSSSGCDSIATLNLSIGNAVNGPAQNVSVCPTQLPYNWNGNNYPAAGIYSVTLTSSSGCDSIVTLNLSISNAVNGPAQNVSVCPTQLPYNWNGNNYPAAGTYTVTLTSSSGCDSIATLNLSIGNAVNGPAQNISVCPTQLPYSWNGNNYAAAGTYNVTLTGSSGCDSIATLNLSVNTATVMAVDTSICPENLPFRWNSNQYTLPGIYTGTFPASNGCDSIVTLTLSLYPSPVAVAGYDDTADYNVPYQLQGSGGSLFEWTPALPLNNNHIANPLAVLASTTQFQLLVKDRNGCTDTDTVVIKIVTSPDILVPSAFTPNGDGINDVFRPRYTGTSFLNFFKVFNRYGELVFLTNNLSGSWDGNYKGVPQQTGAYAWVLQAVDVKGGVWFKQGTVVLIR